INALIRLKGGIAAIPAFRADLARVTGRSDIDVWNNRENFGNAVERIIRYEAACLLAFALAALVAALFLVGQSVARYTSATVADLQVLQAVGMTPRQAVASATAPPLVAAAAGSTLGVAAALVASRWMPIGYASYSEPHPGIDADWLILGPGWILAPLLVAALFLVGQSVARYTSATVADLQVLQAVGMTPRQAVASATAPPLLAAAAGSTLGVVAALVASRWMPIGYASYSEPHPGISADWLILGPGWILAPLLVAAGAAAAAALTLSASRRRSAPRRSAVASAASAGGLGVPVVVGARFALEPGRGRAAVPVRPALLGAVAGVLGVLAAFTFSAGVSDAAANPARFGQTWRLDAFLGVSGQDFGPAGQVLRMAAADPDVTGVDDARIGGAQSGQVSVESFTYDAVAGKRVPAVLTGGHMPSAPDEIVLAPTTASEMRAAIGSVVRLSGAAEPRALTVTGIGFVPAGPHNDYDSGAWLTPAGYDRLFRGARFAFKFHVATFALRPGADPQAVAHRLTAKAAAIKGGQAFPFEVTPPPSILRAVKDVAVLPLALSAFLAVLAIGAVGHALSIAVRRRRHELAVLRALGLTRRQSRLVIITQASLLAAIGIAFGIPLGIALGRILWHAAANTTPLAYNTPWALLALLLIAPVALLAANLLAAWPARRAARLRTAHILRTE
ncbi:MAG TPA: ABC transporter permease, partial [Streptosporangiaceae bacterium]